MKTCSFFGHRDTLQTEELKDNAKIAIKAILKEPVDVD